MSQAVRIRGMDKLVKELNRRNVRMSKALERITDAAAEVIGELAQFKAPGDIQIHLESREATETRHVVVLGPPPDQWYAQILESGAKPHVVRPKNARAMRLYERFAAVVRHPGFAPRPFMRPAVDEGENRAMQAARQEIKRILR